MVLLPLVVSLLVPAATLLFAPIYALILGAINSVRINYLFYIFYYLSMLSLLWNKNILGINFNGESMDVGLTQFANYIGYITVILVLIQGRLKEFLWTSMDTLLLLFVIVLFISGILSFDSKPMFDFFKRLPQFVMLYILTRIFLKKQADFYAFFRLHIFSTLTISAVLLWQSISGDYGRPHFALMAFPMLALIALRLKVKGKYMLLGISAFLSYVSLMADSRRVFISVCLWWILILIQSSKSRVIALLLFVLGFLSYDVVVPETLKKRLDSAFGGVEQLREGEEFKNVSRDAMSDRNTIWLVGWQMFMENPVIGIGTQNSLHYLSEYGYERNKRMHNYYLKILAETGLVGFILLVIIHASALVRINRVRKYSQESSVNVLSSYYYISYVVFLVTSFFGDSGLYSKSMWLTIGVIVSMHIYNKKSIIYNV